MKKAFRALLVLVAVFSVALLTGCGKADLSKYAGKYEGQYGRWVGDETKETDSEFSLELKADRTGSSIKDGATYDVTWSMDGDKIKMTEKFFGLTIDYTGTIKDDELTLYNGPEDEDLTYIYVYTKK